jgi:hypothetical protein
MVAHEVEEALLIECGHLDVRFRDDVCAALSMVDQRQLAEDSAGVNGFEDLAAERDLDVAFGHDVHHLAVVADGHETMPGRILLRVEVAGEHR